MKVVLFGYYGFGNAGDEAVLAGIIAGLRQEGWTIGESAAPSAAGGGRPPLRLTVISGDPAQTRAWHGVDAVARSDWRSLRRLAGEADAWIFGGGSLLQDVTGRLTLPYYCGMVRMAQRRGTPVFFHAQGIGPLRRWTSRLLAGRVLRRMHRISVRDEASSRRVHSMTGGRLPVAVGADPAWLLPLPSAAEREVAVTQAVGTQPLRGESLGKEAVRGVSSSTPPGGWIGVALRPWKGLEALMPRLVDGLREAARQVDAGVLLVPMQDQADEPVARSLRAALAAVGVPAEVAGLGAPPRVRMALLGACRIVVAMRLHALLFAAAQGVGGIALLYDPKVRAAAERLRWRAVDVDAWQRVDWAALLLAAWEESHLVRPERERAADEQRRAARADAVGLSAALAALAAGRGAEAEVKAEAIGDGRAQRPIRNGRLQVLGVGIDRVTREEAVAMATEWMTGAASGGPRHIVTANPEMVMQAKADPELAAILQAAELVVADGIGLVWASHLLGDPLPQRIPGIELAEALLACAAENGVPVYFLGGVPGVAEEAARNLSGRLSGLRVVGFHHGYFSADEEPALYDRIEQSGAALVLVAMGVPRQERWIAAARKRLSARLMVGVGGAFDVFAGRSRRAPVWMQRIGLEWLFRLAQEPKRIGRMASLPRFAVRVVWERWRM